MPWTNSSRNLSVKERVVILNASLGWFHLEFQDTLFLISAWLLCEIHNAESKINLWRLYVKKQTNKKVFSFSFKLLQYTPTKTIPLALYNPLESGVWYPTRLSLQPKLFWWRSVVCRIASLFLLIHTCSYASLRALTSSNPFSLINRRYQNKRFKS